MIKEQGPGSKIEMNRLVTEVRIAYYNKIIIRNTNLSFDSLQISSGREMSDIYLRNESSDEDGEEDKFEGDVDDSEIVNLNQYIDKKHLIEHKKVTKM